MGIAVKKTISLPPELAREVEEIAREEKKPILRRSAQMTLLCSYGMTLGMRSC